MSTSGREPQQSHTFSGPPETPAAVAHAAISMHEFLLPLALYRRLLPHLPIRADYGADSGSQWWAVVNGQIAHFLALGLDAYEADQRGTIVTPPAEREP